MKRILIGFALALSALGVVIALSVTVALVAYPPLVELRRLGTLEQTLNQRFARWLSDRSLSALSVSSWQVDSGADRLALPETRMIPALQTSRLSPSVERADQVGQSWTYSFGDFRAAKYSAHDQINRTTLPDLRPAWVYETPNILRNVQATPIYTGALVVLIDSRGAVVALDPIDGQTRWDFHPPTTRRLARGLVYVAKSDTGEGLILFTADGRLHALDALTGLPAQDFGSGGSIVIGYESRVAPIVDGETVIVASYRPGLHAFSLGNGQHLWSLDFGSGEVFTSRLRRALTLDLNGTPGRPWGGLSLDPERNLVFVTTSDPGPVGLGIARPGDNAPANSVIAVDTQTGRIVWSFQDVAHDLWDLDVSAPPVLGTIQREGQLVDVVFVVTKTGNLLILDRVAGEPVFDLRQRRAPVSVIPGERTAPYQHDPELPQPFGRMEFTTDDITDIGTENAASVAAQLQYATYGFFAPHVANRPTVFFGLHGGANQFGAAYDPQSRRLFVASNHVPASFTLVDRNAPAMDQAAATAGTEVWQTHCASCHGAAMQGGDFAPALAGQPFGYSRETLATMLRNGLRQMPAMPHLTDEDIDALHGYLDAYLAVQDMTDPETILNADPRSLVRSSYSYLLDHEGYPGSRPPWGTLTGYDIDSGRIIWQVPLGRYDELVARGLPITGTPNTGGPIVTAGGLVFVSGTLDRLFRAFDAETGQELWEFELPFVGSASPMTFMHDGAQYIILPATGGGVLAQYHPHVQTGSSFVAFRVEE